MASKALIVFAVLLAAAFFVVASAEDPQPNKGGGGGYPPWNGGDWPGHHPGNFWPRPPVGPGPWNGGWPPRHPDPHPPHWCRWGCCRYSHGHCLRCC